MALAAEQDGHGETVNVSFDTLLVLSFFFLRLRGNVFLLFFPAEISVRFFTKEKHFDSIF